MKKVFFAARVLGSFLGVPISILMLCVFTASFVGAGGGKFLAVATGHAEWGDGLSLLQFATASFGLVLTSWLYAKYSMKHLELTAEWADRQSFT